MTSPASYNRKATERLATYLTKEDMDMLEALCERDGISKTAWMRMAVRKAWRKWKGEGKEEGEEK